MKEMKENGEKMIIDEEKVPSPMEKDTPSEPLPENTTNENLNPLEEVKIKQYTPSKSRVRTTATTIRRINIILEKIEQEKICDEFEVKELIFFSLLLFFANVN